MASTEGLVPITRSFLAKFYDKYPFPPLSPEVVSLFDSLKEQCRIMVAAEGSNGLGNEQLLKDLEITPPHKIDENLWKNREQIEEILYLLQKTNFPRILKEQDTPELNSVVETLEGLEAKMQVLFNIVKEYQAASAEKVFNMVLTYMPQDFRGLLIRQQRERSERRRQAEVQILVDSGGSIHERYALLWRQQMERRKQLALLGSATGMYKALVRFLIGVPQVLLDFVQKINDDSGPMDEQRDRYGPPLYQLTQLSVAIHIFLKLWWRPIDGFVMSTSERIALLERSLNLYTSELSRFLTFLGEVFNNSPFLISAEEAGTAEYKNPTNDFQETIISTGKTHEVLVPVESEGSFVAWEFHLTSGKDVGFSVEYIDPTGTRMPMLPYQRYESHQGNFYSPGVGRYKLIWDNTYSTFIRKSLRYKVDFIPPVSDMQKIDGSVKVEEEIVV
ncbi:hypothetical protein O6H91_20G067700 [Diphasiastrum complanatum]|uniref:Uncharacterized protein n=3 Tax=Diphasiastrum complanatum TaxID=34168 RepID=A0ACC2ARN2_DIPCM|nr:hypothetical protein O6H91_20G067700 [Diphasiastrum complanatum]KAJ7520125.1 hypothetical protein O6H91_20G067700 [Diphasiastrum complanatum]KAJ7520126.1 hypothetical protein O6H91_20G067700 [Diphasiastrum complanatum]